MFSAYCKTPTGAFLTQKTLLEYSFVMQLLLRSARLVWESKSRLIRDILEVIRRNYLLMDITFCVLNFIYFLMKMKYF